MKIIISGGRRRFADCKIVPTCGKLQWKMEQTKIELLGLKLLCERMKQKLESKVTIIQQEAQDLQHHIRTIEIQIKKTLQAKEKELNQLQMELIMVKYRKATMEQLMQLYETIKGEKDLLKVNQDREDAKYWAQKKEVNDMEIKYATL